MRPTLMQLASYLADRARSSLRRSSALVICVMLALVPLHSAFAETRLDTTAIANVAPTDPGQDSSEFGRLVDHHGSHCGCDVVASEPGTIPVIEAERSNMRFAPGPCGFCGAAARPTPPPPRV